MWNQKLPLQVINWKEWMIRKREWWGNKIVTAGSSPGRVCKVSRTKGWEAEKVAILLVREESMSWMKSVSGSRVMSLLSILCEGMWLWQQDSTSGAERSFTGTWVKHRSNSERSRSQQACHQLSFYSWWRLGLWWENQGGSVTRHLGHTWLWVHGHKCHSSIQLGWTFKRDRYMGAILHWCLPEGGLNQRHVLMCLQRWQRGQTNQAGGGQLGR